jgi:hypothetical protein
VLWYVYDFGDDWQHRIEARQRTGPFGVIDFDLVTKERAGRV